MHHRVIGDGVVEFLHLALVRQFAMQQQIADFKEVRILGELVDGVAAIKQNALVAVDEGDVAFAAAVEVKPGSYVKMSASRIELADVHDIGAQRAGEHGQVVGFVFVCQRRGAGGDGLALSHGATPVGSAVGVAALSCTAAIIIGCG